MNYELETYQPGLMVRLFGELIAGLSVILIALFFLGGFVARTSAQIKEPAKNSEMVTVGSKAGMNATITAKTGIDTANAVISIKLTEDNARAYCEGYEQTTSRSCIDRYLLETKLASTISANCPAGTFRTAWGDSYKFLGKNPIPNAAAQYIVADSEGWLLTGDSASGLYETMAQFSALCPKRIAQLDRDKPAASPSFDCKAAKTTIERKICSDPMLVQVDGDMGRIYSQALKQQADRKNLIASQRQWLRTRQTTCGSADAIEMRWCLLSVIISRTTELEALLEANKGRSQLNTTTAPGQKSRISQRDVDSFIAQLRKFWRHDKHDPAINADIRLDRNGYLVGEPVFTAKGDETGAAAAIKRIADALVQGQPYKLPRESYESWKELQITFDAWNSSSASADAPSPVSQSKGDDRSRLLRLGYNQMSLSDFRLDNKSLSAQRSKVALSGYYLKIGGLDYVFPSVFAIQMMRGTANLDGGVGLLTEEAERDSRKYFMTCLQDPVQSQIGCSVNVLGVASICTVTGGEKVPCLQVEKIWWPNR